MTEEIIIPDTFCVAPFYKKADKILVTKNPSLQSYWEEGYFLYDILSMLDNENAKVLSPWDKREELVQQVLLLWKNEGEPFLRDCFHKRNRDKARPMMLKFTSIYIQTMFWLTKTRVPQLQNITDELEKLPFAPMNLKERMDFVLQAPDHHHSFTTLVQLFDESRKKWAIYLNDLNR